MKKICAAIAVARIVGETMVTVTALIGPVDAKSRISAITVAGQKIVGDGAMNTRTATGAAASVAIPDTHKYACRLRRSSRSPSQPPPNVPRKPVTTRIAPGSDDAWVCGTPRTRSRNDGSHAAMPPSAKVYAASPTHVRTYAELRASVPYACSAKASFDWVGSAAAPEGSSHAPRGGSLTESASSASSKPGTPATKNAARQPNRESTRPPSRYPSADPIGIAL